MKLTVAPLTPAPSTTSAAVPPSPAVRPSAPRSRGIGAFTTGAVTDVNSAVAPAAVRRPAVAAAPAPSRATEPGRAPAAAAVPRCTAGHLQDTGGLCGRRGRPVGVDRSNLRRLRWSLLLLDRSRLGWRCCLHRDRLPFVLVSVLQNRKCSASHPAAGIVAVRVSACRRRRGLFRRCNARATAPPQRCLYKDYGAALPRHNKKPAVPQQRE